MGANKKRPALHSVNYVVELFTDEDNQVRRTKVHHVQSQEEETWDGWDGGRLLEFFENREELAVSPAPDEIEEAAQPAAPAEKPVRTVVTPGLLEIEPARAGESLRMRVQMDLGHYPVHGRLNYSAQVFAKRIGHHGNLTVAAGKGSVQAKPQLRIDLEGSPLGVGAYRTFAAVTLTPADTNSAPASMLTEGATLQVV